MCQRGRLFFSLVFQCSLSVSYFKSVFLMLILLFIFCFILFFFKFRAGDVFQSPGGQIKTPALLFFCARFYCLFLSFHLPVEGADRRVCPIYWRLVFAVWSQSPSRLRRICLWRSCLRSFSNHKQVCIALTYSQLYPLAKRESFLFAVFVRGYWVETSVCPCGLSSPALRATSSYQSGGVFLFAVFVRGYRADTSVRPYIVRGYNTLRGFGSKLLLFDKRRGTACGGGDRYCAVIFQSPILCSRFYI